MLCLCRNLLFCFWCPPAYEGTVPIFADVEEDAFNLSSSSLEAAIVQVRQEEKLIPRAIAVVDLFGQPANYSQI